VGFLRDFFFLYVLLVAFIGIYKTYGKDLGYWNSFPWFLLLVGAMDGFGLFINEVLNDRFPKLNFYYYQLFVIPTQVIYYLWFVNKSLKTQWRYFFLGSAVFIISVVIEFFSLVKLEGYYFNSFSFMVANILMLGIILRYFYQLSKSDRILFFYKEKKFWVCLGLLIFWLGSLPFFGIFNYLLKHYLPIFIIYFNVILIFNYLMYTCFLVSFLWTEKGRS
jgi:uncharacterized membrane protein YdcZ (DUF606 family)